MRDPSARTRRALRRRLPAVADRLRAAGQPLSRSVASSGRSENIDLGGTMLYPEPAEAWTRAQLEAHRADPDRIRFTDLSYCNISPLSQTFLDAFVGALGGQGIARKLAPAPVRDVGYLFVFGVGLGYHLPALLAETAARHVVIVEPIDEFLVHALDSVDWPALLDTADRRGIELIFVDARTPDDVCREIQSLIDLKGKTFLDGSEFFVHYPSWTFDECIRLLRVKLKSMYVSDGFFEDEVEMLRNCWGNLRRGPLALIERKVRREQRTPVFIVGAGPSLDRDLPHIRALRERALVVSCGTTIGILLKNGIRPDLHCEIERGALVYDLLRAVHEEHDLSGIGLIASTTIDPRIAPLFARAWFYVRGGLSPATLLTPDVPPVLYLDPLCCNAAFASMAGLGFREIYLFGLDLAQKETGRHHARDSLYFHPGNEEWDQEYRDRFDRTVPGNFGGEVQTSWDFDLGRRMLGRAQQYYRTQLVNCSDGAAIDGAQPRLAASLTLPGPALDRAAVLAGIDRHLRKAAPGEFLDRVVDGDVVARLDDCLPVLDDLFAEWLATSEGFFELEKRLVAAVTGERERCATFHAVARGTMRAMLRVGAFIGNRIEDEDQRLAARGPFAEAYRRCCDEMAATTRRLFAEVGAGEAEAADGCGPRA